MKAPILDRRAQQVRNRAPGASFEIVNFAGTSERWRNLTVDPRATAYSSVSGQLKWNASRWFGGGSSPTPAGTYTLVTGAVDGPNGTGITTYARKTWTVAPATVGNTGDTGFQIGLSGTTAFPVTPGETYTISAYVRTSVVRGCNMGVYQYTAAGASSATPRLTGSSTVTTAGVWTRISQTFTVQSDTAFIGIVADTGSGGSVNWGVGDTIDATGLCVTKTSHLTPFFDGTISGATIFGLGYAASWTGTVNASQSIITGPTPNMNVMRNYCLNPSFETNIVSWNGYVGTGGTPATFITARNLITTGSILGNYSNRATCSVAATSGIQMSYAVAAGPVLVATQIMNCSVWVRSNKAITVTPSIDWYIQSSVTFVSNTAGTPVAISANTWTRISVQGTAPATATTGRLNLVGSSIAWAINDWFEIDGAQFTFSSGMLDYFDGSRTVPGSSFASPDFLPVWSGTADASYTELRTNPPSAWVNTVAVSSLEWASSGSRSLRVIGRVSSDSYAAMEGDTGGMRLGMEAGKTYTALATCRLSAPLTGSLNGFSRRIVAYSRIGAGAYVGLQSSQAANSAGVTQLRLTFLVPVGATESFIRLYNGADAGGGSVWWDDFMLVEGAYTGPYIDGITSKSKWLGSAYASESAGYPSAA